MPFFCRISWLCQLNLMTSSTVVKKGSTVKRNVDIVTIELCVCVCVRALLIAVFRWTMLFWHLYCSVVHMMYYVVALPAFLAFRNNTVVWCSICLRCWTVAVILVNISWRQIRNCLSQSICFPASFLQLSFGTFVFLLSCRPSFCTKTRESANDNARVSMQIIIDVVSAENAYYINLKKFNYFISILKLIGSMYIFNASLLCECYSVHNCRPYADCLFLNI